MVYEIRNNARKLIHVRCPNFEEYISVIARLEAMFADLGHFYVKSIQIAFKSVVFPCILLGYCSQAAFVLHHPQSAGPIFYDSIPSIAEVSVMIVSTTLVTIVMEARQAAEKAINVTKVDERVKRAVTGANKSATAARVAAVKAVQNRVHHNGDSGHSPMPDV